MRANKLIPLPRWYAQRGQWYDGFVVHIAWQSFPHVCTRQTDVHGPLTQTTRNQDARPSHTQTYRHLEYVGSRGSHTVCVFFATIIAHDLPKNDIAQFFVHAYGYRIAYSHVQVDKVAVMTASPPARHEKRQTGRKQLIDTQFAVVQRTPPT